MYLAKLKKVDPKHSANALELVGPYSQNDLTQIFS